MKARPALFAVGRGVGASESPARRNSKGATAEIASRRFRGRIRHRATERRRLFG